MIKIENQLNVKGEGIDNRVIVLEVKEINKLLTRLNTDVKDLYDLIETIDEKVLLKSDQEKIGEDL
ncbi:MAG: hypothetical protein KAU20_01155 [Nanoarchaeota archaeon]|nr:hypothetical protein [Nanoarchaeota archaeon]